MKYVHPNEAHQFSEMDRLDIVEQERRRKFLQEKTRTHGGPTANGKDGDLDGLAVIDRDLLN